MKTPNIDFLLHMTRQYLNGEIDRLDYCMDFPFELEKRYQKASKEDQEYAELLYDLLLEQGTYAGDALSEKALRKLIKHQYDELLDIASGGFL